MYHCTSTVVHSIMSKKYINTDLIFDLINAFKSINSSDESALFLQDILTASEIKNLAIRLRIAKMLLNNEKHRDISRDLRVSIATVTKVNAWLNNKGEGFKKIISRLPIKYDIPTKSIHGPIEYHLPEVLFATAQYLIAKSQDNKSIKLLENLDSKKNIDKELKQVSDDYYKYHRTSTVVHK